MAGRPSPSPAEWDCLFLLGRLGPSTAADLLPYLVRSDAEENATNLAPSTVRSFLHRLVAKGYLKTTAATGVGKQGEYRVYELAIPFDVLLQERIDAFLNLTLNRYLPALEMLRSRTEEVLAEERALPAREVQ